MDPEEAYERWREARSRFEPSGDFAERVMQAVHREPTLADRPRQQPLLARLARSAIWVAAMLAALFRIVELLNIFAATGIEN